MVNRTQALVLGFFVVASLGLLVILVAAPGVYDQALRLPAGSEVADPRRLPGRDTARASGDLADHRSGPPPIRLSARGGGGGWDNRDPGHYHASVPQVAA
jgi:hypothetical protein